MTPAALLRRNLRYFRAANLAVIAGMAVATAVLTGALLVGDSVRGSLRDLVLKRLGPVDFALIAPHFFDQSLAQRLSGENFEVVPALIVRGGASDQSGEHRTGGVQIAAMGGDWIPVAPGQAVINGSLADALGQSAPGATIALQLPAPGNIPRDATLARRALDEIMSRPQVTVASIAREPGLASMFNLEGGQRIGRNVWMNLADLQREARQGGRVNVLLARWKQGSTDLNNVLRGELRLDDYGLKLAQGEAGEWVLSSRSTYIPPAVDKAAERAAVWIDPPLRRVSVQLINNVVRVDAAGNDEASIHYAVAAGISALPDETLAADEVALNAWAAERLQAKVGDRIRLDYYQRRGDGELVEVRSDREGVGLLFRVKEILPMTGLGADRTLTPDYPGLTDKASIREAPPELGIKDELLSDADEAYWKQYRAAPKLLLNLQTAQRLWGDSFGELTSIRIPGQHAETFERELLKHLDPAALGMAFRPIKREQIDAAGAGTDFSMLFVGLSFFLIAASALLAAMLFRLSVESRARQFGLLAAIGFSPRALRRLALAEGVTLALIGGAIGLGGAVGYTWLIVTGLRTWWVDAVGTTALRLHVEPLMLAVGFFAGLMIAALAVAWAVRSLSRAEPVRWLSGAASTHDASRRRPAPIAALLMTCGAVGGGTLLAAGMAGWLSSQAAFFGGGSLLLLGCLSAVAWRLRSEARAGSTDRWSLALLAIRTARRHPARSLLTVSLIALASFLLVTVAAMRQSAPSDPSAKESGTGGFRLIVQAEIPLLADLNTAQGRTRLGMREPDAPIWSQARFTLLRRSAGQDASCLNLTRPDSPTILGVPSLLIRENRFTFARTIEATAEPWTLLERTPADIEEGIPVIADNETAQYILKLGIGQALFIRDQNGLPQRLRLVATLASSIFQSELLMSEANFRKLFPGRSGFGVVMVETSAADVEEISRRLGQELEPFAVSVDSTADRLAAYKQVANTYLSTFQTLGSLGLLLGTIGLAVVLLRGMIERRAELALLSAIGFEPGRRVRLVLVENAALLLAGLICGTVCALIAVLPAGRSIQLGGLAAALGAVLVTGLVVLTVAAWIGGRNITPADLRRE